MNFIDSYIPGKSKYLRCYKDMIKQIISYNRRKRHQIHKKYVYYEQHHIVPIFIEYSLKNLKKHSYNGVLVTPREHFILHILLYKHFKSVKNKISKNKAACPLQWMGYFIGKTSQDYHEYKTDFKYTSEEVQENKDLKRLTHLLAFYNGNLTRVARDLNTTRYFLKKDMMECNLKRRDFIPTKEDIVKENQKLIQRG